MNPRLRLVFCLWLILGTAHCNVKFSPESNVYRCQSNADCLPMFECIPQATLASGGSVASTNKKVCVPKGAPSLDVKGVDSVADISDGDTTLDIGVPDAPAPETLEQVTCATDSDCLNLVLEFAGAFDAQCHKSSCVNGFCTEPEPVALGIEDGGDCDDGDLCTKDDVCDGEGTCTGTKIEDGGNCDDGDLCTKDDVCDGEGTCTGTEIEEDGGCDDGDPCTGDDLYVCDGEGTCIGTDIGEGGDCDDGDPCTEDDICDSDGACHGEKLAENEICNDDDPCTINTNCQGGECVGIPKCSTNAECVNATCDDGNCVLDYEGYCLIEGECFPEGAVHPVDPCQWCDTKTNSNAYSTKGDGSSCTDEDPCVLGGTCVEGDCVNVKADDDGIECEGPGACDLEGACEAGVCIAVQGIENKGECDDGDPCSTGDTCLGGVCQGILLSCPASIVMPCVEPVCTQEGCEAVVSAGSCFCDGMCLKNGDPDPFNECRYCDIGEQTKEWTPMPKGTECGAGNCIGECSKGECVVANQCVADGGCFGLGDLHPKLPCHICEKADSFSEWVPMGPGTACTASFPGQGPGFCRHLPKGSAFDCIWSPQTLVEAGHGWMGCDTCGPKTEIPQHNVFMEEYKIDGTEVTADLFLACLEAKFCFYEGMDSLQQGIVEDCSLKSDGPLPSPGWLLKDAFLPMNCINHPEAALFCEWLGKDLCSEAQWERVAVGTCADKGLDKLVNGNCLIYEPLKYPWGDGAPGCGMALWEECGGVPAPVLPVNGDKPNFASAKYYDAVFGLSGNVSEWTADNYHANYNGAFDNGSAWVTGGDLFVHRGGSYADGPDALRTTSRRSMSKFYRSPAVGFRCCNTK